MDELPAASILIADDDREFCALLTEYLSGQGFAVSCVHDGQAAINKLTRQEFSVLVLDIMMPGMDGLDTLRHLRQHNHPVPVIMLTARGEDIDRIVGLELGADDYLAKPANPRELLARVRAILRRTQPAPDPEEILEIGDLVADAGRRSLLRNGEAIDLTSAEFDVCRALLRHAGTVMSKDRLSEEGLGRRLGNYDRSLDMHISKLRRKLGPLPDGSERIKTVRNRGYLYVRDDT